MRQGQVFALLSGLMLAAMQYAAAAPVRLVSGSNYAPFADPGLPSGGLASELVLAAFAAADVPVEPLQFEPWKRGYGDVLAGAFDATFPYIRSASREAEMIYSDPIYNIVSIALFRAGSGHRYAGPDSLKGMSLCRPIGYASAPSIAALIAAGAIHLEQPTDADLCLRQLAEGRVDVFISTTELIERRADALFGTAKPFVRGERPVDFQPLFLIASRSNPEAADLVRRFDHGLAALRASGRYDEILRRHLQVGG